MNTWDGFLTENAIVMAKRGASVQPQASTAELLFIGEGISGPLLDRMIEAMGLTSQQFHIENSSELDQKIDQTQPKIVIALGEQREPFKAYRGVKLISTYGPSYLQKNPGSKKDTWADLQLVAKELGIQIPKKKES